MKVIENYTTALENSDESLLKEVFAPQVHIEIPAGASLDHPGKTASYIMSQVARTAPGIKCILTADAGNNWYFLGFEGQIDGQSFRRSIKCTSTKMARSINSLSTCAPSRRPKSLRKSSVKDFSLRNRKQCRNRKGGKLFLELQSSSEAHGPVARARPWPSGFTKLRKGVATPTLNLWTSKTSTCHSLTSRCRR